MAENKLSVYKSSPFIGTGKKVIGERFVGRQEVIDRIYDSVVNSYINYSIIGLPKIGKSSLVWNVFMEDRKRFHEDKKVPVYFTLRTNMSVTSFYLTLLDGIIRELSKTDLVEQVSLDELRRIVKDYYSDPQFFKIERFFDIIVEIEICLILIFDEFDAAREIFKISGEFEELRSLTYDRPENVIYVTISRRSIESIEKNLGSSTFFQLFESQFLGLFNSDDLDAYWNRIRAFINEEFEEKLTGLIISTINVFSNAFPYMLDVVNNQLLEGLINPDSSNPEALKTAMGCIQDQYDYFLNIINEEGLLDDAKQILIGPVTKDVSKSIRKLLDYSFIKEVDVEYKKQILQSRVGFELSESKAYSCFSDDLMVYFYRKFKYDNSELLPKYGSLLTILKSLIIQYLIDNYGDNWEEERNSNLVNSLKNLKKQDMDKHITASPDLLYYINETLIINIVKKERAIFKVIFSEGDYQKDILEDLKWLFAIRNHYAHDNSSFLSFQEICRAKEICDRFCNMIDNWKRTKRNLKSSNPQ